MNREEITDIAYGFDKSYERVTPEKIEEQTRWHTYYSKVVRHKESGKFFEVLWGTGSTECQDNPEDFSMYEVEPKTVETVVYRKVETFVKEGL